MNNPVFPIPYIKLAKFCEFTGYTEKAIRRKIEEGKWLAGKHYIKSPDGYIMINVQGYQEWVENAA